MEKKSTGFCDRKGSELFLGDTVEIFTGDRGEVAFQNSCYGISFDHDINRETLSDYAQEENPVLFNNTQFLSFYEILWNWECEGSCLPIVIKREKERSARKRLTDKLVSEKREFIKEFDVSRITSDEESAYSYLTTISDDICLMTDFITTFDGGCEDWDDELFEALLQKNNLFGYLKNSLLASKYYPDSDSLLEKTLRETAEKLVK